MAAVVLRIILGALYVAMAVGQLASWQAMPDILGAYQGVPDEMLPWFAAALIGAEFVAGAWFLALPRSQTLIRGGLRARTTKPMTLISQPAKETAGA